MALQHGNLAHLLNTNYKTEVTRWLAEDCPSFDYGGFVVGDAPSEAKLLGKSAVCYHKCPVFARVGSVILAPSMIDGVSYRFPHLCSFPDLSQKPQSMITCLGDSISYTPKGVELLS